MPRRRSSGFTLLEVMVAIAILGLGLTAILSAQAGAFANSAHARNISIATGLLRCKMTELEEHLRHDGFTELDEVDSGPCCDDQDTPNMQCSWKIEKPQFPEPKYGELDLNAGLDLGGLDLSGSGDKAGAPPGLDPGAAAGALAGLDKSDMHLDSNAGIGDLAKQIFPSGSEGGSESGQPGGGGLVGMAMSFVYPSLKPILEASARRITVTVTWRSGMREQSIELVQWYTKPQKGPTEREDTGGGGGRP